MMFRILSIFLLIFLCGCIETQNCTIIHKDGSCTEKVVIKAPNILKSDGIDSKLAQLEENGYKYTVESTDSVQSVTISKTYKSIKEMYSGKHFDPMTNELFSSKNNLNYSDFNLFFIRKIVFKETMPPSKLNMAELNFLKPVISNKRIIEMPCAISHSNADSLDSKTNTAVWDITSEKTEKGFTFEVECFYINYTAIIILFLVIVIIFMLLSKKKSK